MKHKEKKTNKFNHIEIMNFYQQKIPFKLLKDNPQTEKIFGTIQGIIIQNSLREKHLEEKDV